MSTRVNFSNSRSGLLDQKHLIWKNNKPQFSTNQMLKGEIKKKSIIQKDKKTIKRMMIKIEIKNKFYFLIKDLNWKEKSI